MCGMGSCKCLRVALLCRLQTLDLRAGSGLLRLFASNMALRPDPEEVVLTTLNIHEPRKTSYSGAVEFK